VVDAKMVREFSPQDGVELKRLAEQTRHVRQVAGQARILEIQLAAGDFNGANPATDFNRVSALFGLQKRFADFAASAPSAASKTALMTASERLGTFAQERVAALSSPGDAPTKEEMTHVTEPLARARKALEDDQRDAMQQVRDLVNAAAQRSGQHPHPAQGAGGGQWREPSEDAQWASTALLEAMMTRSMARLSTEQLKPTAQASISAIDRQR
jgi:hypothetical protein